MFPLISLYVVPSNLTLNMKILIHKVLIRCRLRSRPIWSFTLIHKVLTHCYLCLHPLWSLTITHRALTSCRLRLRPPWSFTLIHKAPTRMLTRKFRNHWNTWRKRLSAAQTTAICKESCETQRRPGDKTFSIKFRNGKFPEPWYGRFGPAKRRFRPRVATMRPFWRQNAGSARRPPYLFDA